MLPATPGQKIGYEFSLSKTIKYTWKIHNILTSMRYDVNHPRQCVRESSLFPASSASPYGQWKVQLFLNDSPESRRSKDHLSLCVIYKGSCEKLANIAFSILDATGTEVVLKSCAQIFNLDNSTLTEDKFLAKNLLLENKDVLLSSGNLTLFIKITTNKIEIISPKIESHTSQNSQLEKDLKGLDSSIENCDVIISVDNKKFKAHTSIINVRSPVLGAKIIDDMVENKTNVVSIMEITSELFEKLLEYIYTDQVSNLHEVAVDLIEAAHKYQIVPLVKICEISLRQSLNRENMIKFLVLADRYNTNDLMNDIIKCFDLDLLHILETNDYKEFEQTNHALALELMKKIILLKNRMRNNITLYYEC